MISDYFSFICSYICRESIKNLSRNLSEDERKSFSNHDYYYLTAIHYMAQPTFSQVAQELGLTKPAITLLMKRLGKLKLVEKIQSDHDKRVYRIRLTEKGRQVVLGDELAYEKISTLIQSLVQDPVQLNWMDELLANIVAALKEKED